MPRPVDERAWVLGGEPLGSRLILGSGGFADVATFEAALTASGADMVTVAMRRIDQAPPGLLDAITSSLSHDVSSASRASAAVRMASSAL